MADPKIVFAALPHVQVIWLTEDGHFHLHPDNGGMEVTRESLDEGSKDDDEHIPDENPPGDEKPDVPEVTKVAEVGADSQVPEIPSTDVHAEVPAEPQVPEIPSDDVPEVTKVAEVRAEVSKPRPNNGRSKSK